MCYQETIDIFIPYIRSNFRMKIFTKIRKLQDIFENKFSYNINNDVQLSE